MANLIYRVVSACGATVHVHSLAIQHDGRLQILAVGGVGRGAKTIRDARVLTASADLSNVTAKQVAEGRGTAARVAGCAVPLNFVVVCICYAARWLAPCLWGNSGRG
jgi:hypothetical protein